MSSNYEQICQENRKRYGEIGALKSGKLAANLYDDRTHFIFELLQNAEDALGRRGHWDGSRKVSFYLKENKLVLSHYGKPFDEKDVRSICDIDESTKNESSIGRFGLGFKSVYTVTDLPEIYSGDESFAIEEYVFPKRISPLNRNRDETQIVLPFKLEDSSVAHDIEVGLRQLSVSSLLFLRNIEEISWNTYEGASGFYQRSQPEWLGQNVRRISLIGQEAEEEVSQSWLIFHREVFSTERQKAGQVEIAFSLDEESDEQGRLKVKPLANSPLVVFFPTVVETHLGFLVQGPFRTTPSRDNVSSNDPWNQYLVKETSELLVEAMRWMRDNTMLDASVLRCLPLNREQFPENSRFSFMFDAVLQALQNEKLLPTFEGGFGSASQVKLANAKDLRELFGAGQLALLFSPEVNAWLSSDITRNKEETAKIYKYLMSELKIEEVTPVKIVPLLNEKFLEAQSDEWMVLLYQYLSNQEKTLHRRLDKIPLIRLEDGAHVVAYENGKANAFLPSSITSGFPTVRRSICTTPEARSFLSSLGITEPDPVDDVIYNFLPKYQQQEIEVDDETYAADIERILVAHNTDSKTQKEKLMSALRDAAFVKAVDVTDGKSCFAKPSEVYIATDRLQQLFIGVSGVLFVNNEYAILRGEKVRNLLVSSGVSRYLSPQRITSKLLESEKKQIRKEAGLESMSGQRQPKDFTLRGLAEWLDFLPTLLPEEAATRAEILWEALIDLEVHAPASFHGTYEWWYYVQKKAQFDADFVRVLNQVAWVPNSNGKLVPPNFVDFSTLGWEYNSSLLDKIKFKPQIIDQFSKETGIPLEVLDFLRSDPSIVAELKSKLSTNLVQKLGDLPDCEIRAEKLSDDTQMDGMPAIRSGALGQDGYHNEGKHNRNSFPNNESLKEGKPQKRTAGYAGGRPFISYVGVHADKANPDTDSQEQAVRMQIEKQAIELIISLEPQLQRTPEGNPGFDLFKTDNDGNTIRWIEVKSMTGTLEDRPVGLSHTQFDYAREKGEAYWLYVVEHATVPAQARVLRIQNPAGQASTFTFDHGWREIAILQNAKNSSS